MTIRDHIDVLGFAGSLREGSYNRALLRLAERVLPAGMQLSIEEIGDIPHFDADVEAEGDPEPVTRFKQSIDQADAILIATPEYQHSIPGVLKNALDWASRPPANAPITGKPAAILGATTGSFGTARAQAHLRAVLAYNGCPTVPAPEVLVSKAPDKVEDGEFADEVTADLTHELLRELRRLALLWRGVEPAAA